jgi:cation transporter-like permease
MSAFGGIALENMKQVFIMILPFVILYPTLNDMIGDYGSIISSKFGTMLHQGKITDGLWSNKELRKLFYQITVISMTTGIMSASASICISIFSGYHVTKLSALKIYGIVLLDIFLLVSVLFITSTKAGRYYFKKQEDPNNFLIPIATSLADLGNGLVLALLITLLF